MAQAESSEAIKPLPRSVAREKGEGEENQPLLPGFPPERFPKQTLK